MKKIQCLNCEKIFEVYESRKNVKFCSRICKIDFAKKNSGTIKICIECGKEFHVHGKPKNRNLCSKECQYLHRRNGVKLKCDYCGCDIYKRKSEMKNKKNFFCGVDCANNFQKCQKIELNCLICGKNFKTYPSTIIHSEKRGWSVKYCSIKCRDKDENRNEVLKQLRTKERVKIICKGCGKEFLARLSVIKSMELKGWKKGYCSLKCANNSPERLLQLIKMNNEQNKSKELNKLEKFGSNLLRDLDLNFEEQFLINEKISVDIFIPKSNLIIQWWGNYWHGHKDFLKNNTPNAAQKRRMDLDKSQHNYLTKCGYKILYFWEDDVYKKTDEVLERIRQSV